MTNKLKLYENLLETIAALHHQGDEQQQKLADKLSTQLALHLDTCGLGISDLDVEEDKEGFE